MRFGVSWFRFKGLGFGDSSLLLLGLGFRVLKPWGARLRVVESLRSRNLS